MFLIRLIVSQAEFAQDAQQLIVCHEFCVKTVPFEQRPVNTCIFLYGSNWYLTISDDLPGSFLSIVAYSILNMHFIWIVYK